MAKFTPKEAAVSLKSAVSLVERPDGVFKWVTFEELSGAYEEGFRLINEEKRTAYEMGRTAYVACGRNK